MLHKMRLKSEEFYNIKYNNKIMEVRLNDEKRKKIKVGDKIIFYRLPELGEFIFVTVEEIYKFMTFKQLYNMFPLHYFGYNNQNINEILNRIYSIYSPEQEEKNGVIAIKFKVEDIKASHQ
ncbi:ASCH domain-containing protein [Clostridium sp. JN-9]|uniref:ASCH domain-containing protein n=1 Tax=Clostridium sp. JN-9 TaxID=2507159 RepID=UPI000FFE0E6C|nr:ASCH domain-containing protein [Clostridium sp. JN-9]QAT38822.1 ASCH domain-containing protein [Clostridium sp. JN-9]